jgi:hypothetical protein
MGSTTSEVTMLLRRQSAFKLGLQAIVNFHRISNGGARNAATQEGSFVELARAGGIAAEEPLSTRPAGAYDTLS